MSFLFASICIANPWVEISNKAGDLSDQMKVLNVGVSGDVYMGGDATNPFKPNEKVGNTLRHDFYVGKGSSTGGAWITIGTDFNNYCKVEMQLKRDLVRDDIVSSVKVTDEKGTITCGQMVVDSHPRTIHIDVYKK